MDGKSENSQQGRYHSGQLTANTCPVYHMGNFLGYWLDCCWGLVGQQEAWDWVQLRGNSHPVLSKVLKILCMLASSLGNQKSEERRRLNGDVSWAAEPMTWEWVVYCREGAIPPKTEGVTMRVSSLFGGWSQAWTGYVCLCKQDYSQGGSCQISIIVRAPQASPEDMEMGTLLPISSGLSPPLSVMFMHSRSL